MTLESVCGLEQGVNGRQTNQCSRGSLRSGQIRSSQLSTLHSSGQRSHVCSSGPWWRRDIHSRTNNPHVIHRRGSGLQVVEFVSDKTHWRSPCFVVTLSWPLIFSGQLFGCRTGACSLRSLRLRRFAKLSSSCHALTGRQQGTAARCGRDETGMPTLR